MAALGCVGRAAPRGHKGRAVLWEVGSCPSSAQSRPWGRLALALLGWGGGCCTGSCVPLRGLPGHAQGHAGHFTRVPDKAPRAEALGVGVGVQKRGW